MGSSRVRHPGRAALLAFAAAAGLLSLGCTSIPKGRSAVDAVEFEGVHSVREGDLASKLATSPTPKFLGLFRGLVYEYAVYDPFVLERDLERVERYYRARGFYETRARAGRVLNVAPNRVRIEIVVDEGPPVVVGDVHIEGIEGLPDRARSEAWDSVKQSGVTRGDRLDEDEFESAEWKLRRALQDESYAYVKVERRAEVDLPTHTASVTFVVTPDQPATLGVITIKGLGAIPEGPVRRTLDLREGEKFSAGLLERTQQAVLDLGIFTSVVVHPELADPPPEDRAVPITAEVQSGRLRNVRLGGGLELDVIKTNVHGLVGWTDANFLGGLRRFDVDLRPGVALYPTRIGAFQKPTSLLPEERFRIQLSQPGFVEARTHGFARGEFNIYPLLLTPNINPSAPVVGYREARGAAGVDRTFWKLYANLSYNLQLNVPFTYVGALDPDLQRALISYIDLLTNLDFRDDRVHPRKGIFIGNDLQWAGGPLKGDANDVRIQPQARAYVPVSRATLALRATVGLVLPMNYGHSLTLAPPGEAPPGVDRATWIRDQQLVYFRGFFSGGPTSNRGYPIWGVGPHGPVPFFSPNIAIQQFRNNCIPGTMNYSSQQCAVPLGGLTLWEVSAELRVPIWDPLEGAVFCDTSDVELGMVELSIRDPHASCGVGLRYGTPVGPVRLDVAYRLPGLNPGPDSPDYPGSVLGLPIGVAFGIGEAF
jgi:outer membrane protein insertion porin family/translocation and assembly module TamA